MASTNTNDNTNEMTLYERMGGDVTCELMTQSFFDEALEVPSIMHIFTNVPRNALKTHQIKLFRVIFGKEEERPSPEDFMDFMLRTHTRLFRDLGLDETHFDIIGKCLLNGMETFQLAPDVIEEVMTMLVPLRAMFEYGAKVAKQEREMSEEEKDSLPRASMATIGTDQPVVLPVYSTVDIPDWLPQTLLKKKAAEPNAYAALSMENVVREWTCNLTNRFDADKKIADTFMDQPFMDHHVYLVFFLQLAFFPKESPVVEKNHILNMVLYPRGPDEAPLSKELLDRMINEFTKACKEMGLADKLMESAVERLRSHRHIFAETTTKVGGFTSPHILRVIPEHEQVKKLVFDTSTMEKMPRLLSRSRVGKLEKDQSKDAESVASKTTACTDDNSAKEVPSFNKVRGGGHGSWKWSKLFRRRRNQATVAN